MWFLPRGQWPVIKCRWVEFSSQAWALNKDPLEKQDSEDWKETSQGAVQWSSSHRCERKSRIHPKDQWSHDRQDILTWGSVSTGWLEWRWGGKRQSCWVLD